MALDLVYPLKKNGSRIGNTELRLSLRSVEQNLQLELGQLWIYGAEMPEWLQGAHLEVMHDRSDKAINLREKYRRMARTPALSDPFVLLDDDHMFLQPWSSLPVHAMGALEDLARKYNGSTHGSYIAHCLRRLQVAKLPTVNYQVHFPMLIQKEVLHRAVGMMGRPMVMGSLYGNLVDGPRVELERDFRINTEEEFRALREGPFASFPPVLKPSWVAWLQERFPARSRWEAAAAAAA